MKRRFLALLGLIVIAAMIITACSPPEEPPEVENTEEVVEQPEETEEAVEEEEEAEPEPEEEVEKRVLYLNGSARVVPGQEEAWAEVNAAFEEEYGVEVVTRWQGEWSDIAQQLQTARIAEEQVDITTCGANQINGILVRSGLIKDITEAIAPIQDRWVEGMFDPYTIAGRVWAVPWDVASTSVVLYNKSVFDELGIPEPTTYADLVAATETITSERPDAIPWLHQGKAPWMWPMMFFEAFAQTSGNNSLDYTFDFLAGDRQFTSEEEIAAFEALKNLYADGVLTQETFDTDTEGMRAAFAQQKALIIYVGTWEMPNVRESVGDSFEVGAFEFPLITDDPDVVSQHGGGADGCLAIPSFAPEENFDIQLQYLEFISRAENANKIIQPALPLLPVLNSVEAVDDPLAEEFNTQFVPHTIRFLDWIWPTEVNGAVMDAIPAVMLGNLTPEEAAASVQDAFDTLVAETEYQFSWWEAYTDEDWAALTPDIVPEYEIGE